MCRKKLVGSCCMAQGAQLGALWWTREVGWAVGGREASEGGDVRIHGAVLSKQQKKESQGLPNTTEEQSYLCSSFPPCLGQSHYCNGTWNSQSYSCTCHRCTSRETLCTHWYLQAEQSRNVELVETNEEVHHFKWRTYLDGNSCTQVRMEGGGGVKF